ncbi:MAG: TRAP transporter large permease [Betaproteobacteria bacterium]|nr:TRAP transporter large permease [Betaproteobacteria bacterium]
MEPVTVVLLGLVGMFVLILLHVPLGVAMGIAGVVGFGVLASFKPAFTLLASETASSFSSSDLATIPLFIMMGGFASAAGLSEDLYRMAYALVGHRRGGLAMATIGGCAGFGAVCGSSIATTATFGRVALPPMQARGYAPGFATGTVAAGGTLGILVPPSIIMVIYAVLAEQLIITLYIAAIVPSILAVALHFAAIAIYTRIRPNDAPAGERMLFKERVREFARGWAVLTLILIVLGGISFGIFTAVEGAAVGAALAFIFALLRRSLDKNTFKQTLIDVASTTAMIYVIIIGASLFGYFVAISKAPQEIIGAISGAGLSMPMVLFLLMVMYLLLGAVFDEVAAMVITLPFVLPLIKSWGFDPVWWGIINVVIIELGMLIPPIGMNVFVIHGIAPQVPLIAIYRGVTPYIASNLLRLAILLAFPALCLWLPAYLKG